MTTLDTPWRLRLCETLDANLFDSDILGAERVAADPDAATRMAIRRALAASAPFAGVAEADLAAFAAVLDLIQLAPAWRSCRAGAPPAAASRRAVLNSVHRSAAVRKASDVYMHPALDDVEIFEWKAIDRAIEAGYRTAVSALVGWAGADAGAGVAAASGGGRRTAATA
jgi:predicted acylesterase/phospholipase RssA